MNALSGEDLTGVFSLMKSMRGIARDTDGTLGGVRSNARFCRTTATCIWGVSDPLKTLTGP
jgi:hypothetical protein